MPSAGQLVVAVSPTPLGVPVTVVNVNQALGAPGSIVLSRATPAPAVSRTVDLAGVIWSSSAITFPVPTNLPVAPSATEQWQIVITNDAGTVFDPLPITIRSSAPVTAKVLTAGGGPANLEAPVTIIPVGGTFGTATVTSGTVTLTRGSDVVTVSAERVVWTALAVTFTVPRDLPTGASPQTWQVTVQPTGWAACGPYPLEVLAIPALVFVPPTSVSERRIDLVTVGAGPNSTVRFYDRTGRRIQHNLPPATRTVTGLAAQMPTLREVMDAGTTEFDENQLTMRLRVTVYDPDSGRETPQTDALATTMAAPPPAVGPAKAASAQGRLVLGEGNRPAELGDQLSLEWVGAPARGRVTFHPLDITLLDRLADLQLGVAQLLKAPLGPDLTVPAGSQLLSDLRALRSSGQPPRSIIHWSEERIELDVPTGWTNGVVLVWRDDLPSPAIVLPDIPIPDLCRPGALQSALSQLVGLAAPTQVNPGDAITIESIQLGTPVPGSLSQQLITALGQAGTTLSFACRIAGAPTDGAPRLGPVNLNLSNPAGSLLNGLRIQPQVVSYESGPSVGRNTITVALEATLTGLCTNPSTVVVDTLQIVQLPVRLPTVVAGFDRRHATTSNADAFGYPTILFLPAANGLVSGVIDRGNGTAALEAAKATVLAPLTAANAALGALSPIFPGILGASHLNWLGYFINKIASTPANDLVITAEQSRNNLDYNPGWWNKISALCMLGVGDGSTSPRLKLFEANNRTSHEFHVRMPAGFIAASYWTIHESAFQGGFSSPPAIPAPGPGQQGRSANYPFASFGNMAKSFDWS